MPSFDTLRFEFDRQAGWTRQGAAEWLSRHLGACDTGRTVFLGTPHRLQPALGHAILDLLGLCSEPSTNGCSRTPAIRFIPVPGPEGDRRRSRDGRRPAEPHRVAGPRGAGFEVNLGAPGHGEPLPADIRVSLQSRGLVNYPEALAVVQTLEELLADSVFLAEATAWQQHNGRGEPATLFVTALHAAQVELLRAVLTRSRNLLRAGLQNRGDGQFRLSGSVPLEIRVETPSALRHRDCVALLLSMTRSHSHRAVALAEEAAWLPLALTRASSRLILFGDTGTLLRRTQWRGAVDHLDEFAAERERELAIRLVERVLGLELPPAPIPPTAAARR